MEMGYIIGALRYFLMLTQKETKTPFITMSVSCNNSSISNGIALHWRHNDHGGVSNHQPHGWLLNRLFRRRSKKTSKLRVTGVCTGNSPGTGEFPAQMASNAENVTIGWRRHGNYMKRFSIANHCSTYGTEWLMLYTHTIPQTLIFHVSTDVLCGT